MNSSEWRSIETDPPSLLQAGEFTDGVFRVLGRVDQFSDEVLVRPYRANDIPLKDFTFWRELDELPEQVRESFWERHPEARRLNPPGAPHPLGVVLTRQLK